MENKGLPKKLEEIVPPTNFRVFLNLVRTISSSYGREAAICFFEKHIETYLN